jgi:hypothetical protein
MVTEDIPTTAIPSNIYMLIYLLFALAIGPAGLAIAKAIRDYKADRASGHKDHIAEMEDWNNDIIRERNYYHDLSVWRGELIGRLEYVMNTHPHCGPEVVREVHQAMPLEPRWPDHRHPPTNGHRTPKPLD